MPGFGIALPAILATLYFLHSLSEFARLAFGFTSPYMTGPMIQGANSSSPTPDSSLLLRLTEGTALQPNTEPRPVVKQIMLQPPATSPVMDTGSCPGVSMNTKPRVVMGSPYWKTSIIGVVPPLVTPPSDFSKTVVIPPALLPGVGLLSMASMPRQYHSHHL